MRGRLLPVLFALLLIPALAAVPDPLAIPLWPEGVPGLRADASPERVVNGRITNIHYPSLTVYQPARPNGTAVVYAPSGGYVKLTILGEGGGPETRWLNSLGVTVFLLKYRLNDYGHPAPLQDMLRALRVVRSRAAEFGVDVNRIGVVGASAGGHLSGCAATLWDSPEGKTGTAFDAISARPDFAVLVYPVITMETAFANKGSREALLGREPTPQQVAALSLEQRVRKDTPPVILIATMADRSVPVENTLRLYQALRNAGVPAEMHVYAQGSHGDSLDPQYGPTALWPQRVEEWMRHNGWLPATPDR